MPPALRQPQLQTISLVTGVVCLVLAAGAHAAEPETAPDAFASPGAVPEPGTYAHVFATLAVGDSLRLNNPYRLSHQLGDTGESLSITPPYLSLGGGTTLGDPDGWQHGAMIQWSAALGGLPQHVVTPSYVLLQGAWRPALVYGRAGLPIILNPDANVGGELALGGSYLFTAGLGINVEVIGDIFYGAATWTTGITTIPMLSIQLGFTVDYEELP